MCVSAPLSAEKLILQDVRHWTLNGVTRVAVQLNGKAEVRRSRLSKPDRYFFDFQNTGTTGKAMQTIAVGDSLVRQIRIAEAKPGVARVVLDLVETAEVVTSELDNPYRLVIEVRKPGLSREPALSAAPVAERAKPVKAARPFVPPPRGPKLLLATAILPAPPVLKYLHASAIPPLPKFKFPAFRAVSAQLVTPRFDPAPAQTAQTARRSATGANSMTRALGLKIRRIVIDESPNIEEDALLLQKTWKSL